MSSIVAPHGGTLVDRLVPEDEAAALRERAENLPRLALDTRELADLELVATGAASPLTGFLGYRDYRSVLERLRLANGTPWPLPFTLAVTIPQMAAIMRSGAAALHDAAGRLWGVVEATDAYVRDPLDEARSLYRSEDPAHPGVAYLLSRPRGLVGGPVHVLPLPAAGEERRRLAPSVLRAVVAERGWRRTAGFPTWGPIRRSPRDLARLVLEYADGLVVHSLVAVEEGEGEPDAPLRLWAEQRLLDAYGPGNRAVLAASPAAPRLSPARDALLRALVLRNHGADLVFLEAAGATREEARRILARFDPGELGFTPLWFDSPARWEAATAAA
jgi:sulfate adenylyltransferase